MTQHLENNWPCLFCRTVCAQMNQDKPFFTEMCISMVEIFLFFKHLSPEEPTSMSFKTPLQFSLKREELHVSVENSSSISSLPRQSQTGNAVPMCDGERWVLVTCCGCWLEHVHPAGHSALLSSGVSNSHNMHSYKEGNTKSVSPIILLPNIFTR